MFWLLSIGIECLSSLVFIIPAVIVLQYVIFRQRSLSKLFMVFVFAFYSAAVFSVAGIPTVDMFGVAFSFNVMPFIDIFNNPVAYIKQEILNIILFMPMGFLLPVIWKEYRSVKKTVFMGLAVSVVVEFLQLFTFRLTDIDDLITNTLGTFLGYCCGKIISFKLPMKLTVNDENNFTEYEPVVILTVVFLIAFFLQPFVSDAIWDMVLSGSSWESIK